MTEHFEVFANEPWEYSTNQYGTDIYTQKTQWGDVRIIRMNDGPWFYQIRRNGSVANGRERKLAIQAMNDLTEELIKRRLYV